MERKTKNEIIDMLLNILESVCEVVGKLVSKLAVEFPKIQKYLMAFLKGVSELMVNVGKINENV